MSRQSTKNKKYALRKIGKVFGSCVVATVITLGGAAIMAPSVTVYASDTGAGGTEHIDALSSNDDGYKVIVPKKVIYRGNDQLDNETPTKVHTGYNGVSYILKANDVDENELEDHFNDKPMGELFNKLYDEDEDGQTDEKYKREDADKVNENAGNPIPGTEFVEPAVSEIKPEYPHLIDADVLYNPENDSNHDGKPDGADGKFDDQDTIVYSNKPITVNKNSEDNVINEDGTVVLSKYYRIHVNEGEHADKDDDIYEVGTKPTVTTNEIDFKTIYEPNDQDVAGHQIEKTPGKKGTSTTTTTYTVNPETGARTANPSTTEETEKPVNKVVLVGTKPKEVVETTPKTTRYVGDPDTPYNTKVTSVDGHDGSVTKKTTYDLDEHTGTVTPHETITERVDKVDTVIKVGNKQVTTSEIPMTVTYKEDPTLEGGKTVVDVEGAPGEKETTTVYDVSETDGSLSNPQATEKTTTVMTPRVVRVGTKPKEVETPIPSPTTYEANPDLKKDEKKTKTQGTPGKRIQEITYKWIPNTDKVEEVPGGDGEEDPTPTVIEVGNVEKEVVETEITTRYIPDETKTRDEKEVVTPGSKGVHTKTTTYSVNPNTGETHTPVVTEDDTPMEQKVVKVGIKPVETTEIIDITTKYIQDPDLDYGKTVIDNPGSEGKIVTTTTYTLNEQDGTTTENQPTVQKTEMVQKVVRVGVKPKVVETPIPYTTRYVEDNTKDKDYRETTQVGVKGKETTTTTYTMDPNTGTVTENKPTTVTEQPTEEIITVGTKPKVEEKELPFTTRYVEDNTKDKDYRETTQQGVKGKETKTTTYTLDTTNGTVTENNPTTDTEQPTEEIITVGTKPKVEEKELPFTTRYVEDNTKDKDYRETTQQGVKGKETKTTTYTLDTTNGTVTENAPTTDTEQPTEEIITVGTKPKVVETPETPQPKPGETPETPQPSQPTAPEEAPAQPGQPSEPENQPNLKVAPPTIAIVEEPNKASIEVKAPKKDADTVKITYPKSDGSGNEVLTLTKQPNGEWTLDKQPENVTLDKKTGTVTIPRESVVNKEKVQAQSKHKTSGYTPFVEAALSIEEANPEYPVTLWVDGAGTEIKERVEGQKVEAGEIPGYKWLSSRLENGLLTHTFEKVTNGTPTSPSSPSHPRTPSSSPSTSTPEKPNKAETPVVRTVWRDENGKDLKVPSVDKQEAGEVEGYEFVESHREGDDLTVHVFRSKQAQTPAPKDQTPSPEQAASPAPSKVSEQKGEAVATATSEKTVDSATSTKTSDKAELPNTGTEANATLASAGIMTLLAGLGLGFFKKKED
ncbi:G5 domain-containing protein [Streptococcus pneumoniae]|uniref:G5 domain-containing protein n=1 Tax=Streptococcus pseudopneumoniae TaxID=257758 RepID=UPI0031272817